MLVLQLFLLPLIDAHRWFNSHTNPVLPEQHDLSIGKCSGTWSAWYDRDDPGWFGDYEILHHLKHHDGNNLCGNPIAAEARIKGSDKTVTTQNVQLTLKGFICKNYKQQWGKMCSDYEVRFCCDKSESEKWFLPKEEDDCWNQCKGKSGRCEQCGENGYCCSAKKLYQNGDCPSDSVTYMATKTSKTSHMCVAKRNDHKVWHGEANIATYSIIGGIHGRYGASLMFDNKAGDKSMYHSNQCSGVYNNKGVVVDKGVVIDFVSPVQYIDVLLHTRRACCHDRYKNVCLYADNVKLGCTPADLKEAPDVINFKDYTNSKAPIIAHQYRLMFEDTECAQIEELFVKYLEVDSTTMPTTTTLATIPTTIQTTIATTIPTTIPTSKIYVTEALVNIPTNVTKDVKRVSHGRCGPKYNFDCESDSPCCSHDGYCTTADHCTLSNLVQATINTWANHTLKIIVILLSVILFCGLIMGAIFVCKRNQKNSVVVIDGHNSFPSQSDPPMQTKPPTYEETRQSK